MEHMTTLPIPGQAKPFTAEPSLDGLPLHHPAPEQVARLAQCRTSWGREAFVRLWLTEGTPYAFRECPALYEDVRGWLGSRLNVCPKNITLSGSARLGFSLSPPPKYGQPFDNGSDFDIALVSSAVLDRFREAFLLWEEDYKTGAVKPRNDTERRYWDANLDFWHQNLPRGFLDAKKLPTLDCYPVSQQYNSAMWALIKKLEVTPGAPVPSRASVRVYKDWRSLVRHVAFNVGRALRQLAA